MVIRVNNPAFRYLMNFWSKYVDLEECHWSWAKNQTKIIQGMERNSIVYSEGENQKCIYLVVKGLVGREVNLDRSEKRQLHCIALPGMGMMTTSHLYSETPSLGDIKILRSNTSLICIPYRAIIDFKDGNPGLELLNNVLTNKKKKQLALLRLVSMEKSAFMKCLLFFEHLPELYYTLYQQEIADLLSISKTTVQSVSRFLAKGCGRKV